MIERIDMRGALRLRLTDDEDRVMYEAHYPNHIVLKGRELVAKLFTGELLDGQTPTKVTHMAVGTNNSAAGDNNTALGAERARKEISNVAFAEVTEGGVKRQKVTLTSIFDKTDANPSGTDTGPLTEAGIFTAASGGFMYNRVVFDPVSKTDSFKLTLLWDIVF